MLRSFTTAALATVSFMLHAATCDGSAEGSAAYYRAAKKVLTLPETRTWQNSHSFPVSLLPVVDRKQLVGARCYWSVSVYANRPERLELW